MFGFLGFSVTGIFLPLIALIATTKAGGTIDKLGEKVFPHFGEIYGVMLIIFVGIFFIIPRTAATTYEMSVRPLYPNFSPVISSVIFFGLNIYFAINPTKVVDKIGKILTPVLFISLRFMILKGVVTPMGKTLANEGELSSIVANGFLNGYQTADALGGLLFAGIVVSTFLDKGIVDKKQQMILTVKSALIAVLGLFVVYFGLSYLGSTVSSMYSADIEKTTLLINIINNLLGGVGLSVLGVIVAFACLSTSVGAISASASLIEKISRKKLKYENTVIAISIFCAFFAVKGVESLITMAMPVLLISYPIAIVMVITWIFYEFIPNDGFFTGSVAATIIVATISTMQILGLNLGFASEIVKALPFSEYGFEWILPAVLGGIIGVIICSGKIKKDQGQTKQESDLRI